MRDHNPFYIYIQTRFLIFQKIIYSINPKNWWDNEYIHKTPFSIFKKSVGE